MHATPIKLLLIDDDVEFACFIEAALVGTKSRSIAVDHVTDFEHARQLMAAGIHDAYLVDHGLGIAEKTGFDLLQYGNDVSTKPMIMLTSNLSEGTGDKAIALGASDFLHKQHATIPVIERIVRNSITRNARLQDSRPVKLKLQSQNIDQLTGVYSRVAIEHYLNRAVRACSGTEVGVVMYIDLDNFKPVNDYYGHVAGDQVLKKFAQRMQDSAPVDFELGRIGGDEFLLIGPASQRDVFLDGSVDRWLNTIRTAVSSPMQIYDVAGESVVINIYISIGVVRFGERDKDKDYLIALANKAMYVDQARNKSAVAANACNS